MGKWPEMDGFIEQLDQLLHEQGGHSAALTPEICLAAAKLDWDHRDPFDRLLAATAIHYMVELISADKVFDDLIHRKDWTARLW